MQGTHSFKAAAATILTALALMCPFSLHASGKGEDYAAGGHSAAVLPISVSDYEREAKLLLGELAVQSEAEGPLRQQARKLLRVSEDAVADMRPKAPQCDTYLDAALKLKAELADISHERLEKDYHHDGALPKAGPECYHIKDMFVHAATVVVLLRDDPALAERTRSQIHDEIVEVLSHTGVIMDLL